MTATVSNAETNYGATLKRNGVALGEVVKMGIPELKSEFGENTTQTSGYRESIPLNLFAVGDMSLTVNLTSSASSLKTDFTSKTKAVWSIEFNNSASTILSWNGYVSTFKVNDLDASSPDVLTANVNIKASGSFVLTN